MFILQTFAYQISNSELRKHLDFIVEIIELGYTNGKSNVTSLITTKTYNQAHAYHIGSAYISNIWKLENKYNFDAKIFIYKYY
jgi:hypothetical protein